jgi:hypothetical protein
MKTVWIDSAPLIASPEPTGNLRECEIIEAGCNPLDDSPLYLCPINPPGSPMYVSKSWIRKPSVVIQIHECSDGLWSYFPRAAADLLARHPGQYSTAEQCLERAQADRSIPKGAAYSVVRRPRPTVVYHQDPGHGWMETTLAEVKRLGIADKISSYSYIDRSCSTNPDEFKVYLEEDRDAPLLVKAYQAAGTPADIQSRYVESTGIRALRAYESPMI